MKSFLLALILTTAAEPWWQKCENAAIEFAFDTGAIKLGVDMAWNCRVPVPRPKPPLETEILILEWCAYHPEAPCAELMNAAGK